MIIANERMGRLTLTPVCRENQRTKGMRDRDPDKGFQKSFTLGKLERIRMEANSTLSALPARRAAWRHLTFNRDEAYAS